MINSIQEQLIRDEGFKLKPYRDTKGKLTIGVGRNLDDVGISWAEAMAMLENDILEVCNQLTTNLPWVVQLDKERTAVLINLCFNMGIMKLLLFKRMLAAIQHEDWGFAQNELLNSNYAKQVGDRAQRLAKQLLTGEWQ